MEFDSVLLEETIDSLERGIVGWISLIYGKSLLISLLYWIACVCLYVVTLAVTCKYLTIWSCSAIGSMHSFLPWHVQSQGVCQE